MQKLSEIPASEVVGGRRDFSRKFAICQFLSFSKRCSSGSRADRDI